MLSIYYFAGIREAAGRNSEVLELPESVTDVQGLINLLAHRYPKELSLLTESDRVLVAVDQTVVKRDHQLRGDEEIAFFPPMTGG
jgi:molybdopterin synthase sulfur carrier subunit